MIARRGLLAGILGAAVAPAIITRPGILMPVRTIALPWWATANFLSCGREGLPIENSSEAYAQLLADSVRGRAELIMTPIGAAQLYRPELFSSYPGTLRYRATNRYAAR